MKKLLFAIILLLSCNNPISQKQYIYENTDWRISSIKTIQTTLSNSGKQVFETNMTDSSTIANYYCGISVSGVDTIYWRPIYGLEFKTGNTLNLLMNRSDPSVACIYNLNETLHEIKIMFSDDTNIYYVSPFNKISEKQIELTLPRILTIYYKDSLVSWPAYHFSNMSEQDSIIKSIENSFSPERYDSIIYKIQKWTYDKE
jgi:hypothetical protein